MSEHDHAILVARDAWLTGSDWRGVLDGNGIKNEPEPDTGLDAHDRIELDWIIDGPDRPVSFERLKQLRDALARRIEVVRKLYGGHLP